MDSVIKPLEELRVEAIIFNQRQALSLFHVRVQAELRSAAIEMLLGVEWYPENNRQFFLLAAQRAEPDIWTAFSRELGAAIDLLQESREAAGQARLQGLEVEASQEAPLPLQQFVSVVRRVARAMSREPGCVGATFVFSPYPSTSPQEVVLGLRLLLPEVDPSIKVIWIDASGQPPLASWVTDIGRQVTCDQDVAQREKELDAILAAGSNGRVPGEAWPSESAPLHPAAPAPIAQGGAADLARPILQAIAAARAKDPEAALERAEVASQRAEDAGDLATATELRQLAVALADPLLGEGARPHRQMRAYLERARDRAGAAQAWEQVATTELMMGTLADRDGDTKAAIEAFRRAADVALRANASALAIEALFLAGSTAATAAEALRQPQLNDAVAEVFKEIEDIAKAMPGETARDTRADEATRWLAAYRRTQRLKGGS